MRVGFVCLGNICRSPMADVVMGTLVAELGLAAEIEVASAGTGRWHVGEPMDDRAAATLSAAGYDPSRHRARRFDDVWLEGWDPERDVLLAMDEQNLADVRRIAPGWADGVRLFRDYDPDGPGEVPDPYYGGSQGFAEVLAMVERTCRSLLARLRP